MTRLTFSVLVALTLAAGTAQAQRIEQVPISRTKAFDGPGMYNSYCATCHGLSGVGDGPAAKALAKAPADLTRISARNGGTFPETKVKRYIEGLDEIAAHGSRDMPMWGELFRSLERDTVPLRVQALSDFLKSVQK
jgi:mono/diheme cytochrome c family protein